MFICIEGTEGGGKSTLIQKLKMHFESQGRVVECFREPGGTSYAEKIRELLIWSKQGEEQIHPTTELLLMFASRMQNIYCNIIPALERGSLVITDRYAFSSLAYQIYGRGLERKYFDALFNNYIPVIPDLTYWLDLPVEVGLNRINNRGELDRFEKEKKEFFDRVRSGYENLHREQPERIKRIDATLPPDEVFELALREFNLLNNNNN